MTKKLDNFIPLHARLNGPQLAGWKPSKIAESGLGCQLLSEVMIPLPDGIKLSADVYLPKKPGKYPVILQFAAYNRDLHTTGAPTGSNEIGSPPIITDRGYAQVVITARGVGRSEGKLGFWHSTQEDQDHLDCIEWAAKQPWSNGDVCLFGTSYYGMNQAPMAAKRAPSLRAFFCNEICTDFYRHVFYYGGFFGAEFMGLWMGANFNQSAIHRYIAPWKRALLSQIINRPWLWRLVKPKIDTIMSNFRKNKNVTEEALRWYIQLMADIPKHHDFPAPGPFRDLKDIHIPFVVVQNLGYASLHQYGSYDLFENSGTPLDKKWLILGPAEYELPVYAWQLEALAFFDYIIKGVDNGYAEQAHVRYWTEGENKFNSATNFPIPHATPCRLYLNTQGSNLSIHSLQTEIPNEAKNSWVSIPSGASVLPGIDNLDAQKLVFHWTMTRKVRLAGPLTAQLKYSCNEIDSYLVARVGRLDQHGKYHLLSLGHLRPATREIDHKLSTKCEIVINSSKIEPLERDVPVILRFSLTPAAAQFLPGDSLVFEIASRTDLLHGKVKDGFIHMNMNVPPYFCRNWVHFGKESYLEAPLLEIL